MQFYLYEGLEGFLWEWVDDIAELVCDYGFVKEDEIAESALDLVVFRVLLFRLGFKGFSF